MRGTLHFPVDPDRDPIVTAVSGVFGEEVHAQYLTARASAFRQLRCGSTEHLSRSDLRRMNTQSQEIVNAFSAMLAQPTCQSKRLGLVTARMQLSRALGTRAGGSAQVFLECDAAEHRVLTGEMPAAGDAPA